MERTFSFLPVVSGETLKFSENFVSGRVAKMNLWRCCLFLLLVLTENTLAQDILCYDYYPDYVVGFNITNAKGRTKLSKSCSMDLSETSYKHENHTGDAEKISNLYIGHAPNGYISQKLLEKLPGLQYLSVFYSNMENSGKLSHKNIKGISFGSSTMDPINKYTFRNFPALNLITLYKNKKIVVEKGAFSNLKKMKKIEISSTSELIIQENAFKDLNVNKLDLSYNRIEELDLNDFKTISGLESFVLRKCGLKKLHSADNFLSTISYFILRENQLESLDLTAIEVHILDVAENKLKNLMIGKNCQDLQLSFNQISNISLKNSFSTLKIIFMNDNLLGDNLHEICECINVEYLNLRRNKISEIGSCFSNMKNLKEVDLHGNDISIIYPDSFHPENNIISLDLSGNKLEYFLEDSMKNFPKMQHINLNNNKIFALYDDPKHFMPALKEIELLGNNFECSELKKVWKKLKRQGVEISSLSEIQCKDLSTDTKIANLHNKISLFLVKMNKIQNSFSTIKEKQNTLEIDIRLVKESVKESVEKCENFQVQDENKTNSIENELKSLKENAEKYENSQKNYENKINFIEKELKSVKETSVKFENALLDKNKKITLLESYINSVNETIEKINYNFIQKSNDLEKRF
ncbi:protein artichoke-like [Lutzomyia longipalpis]|uniref:protein artichoke-like n=1 Tax=Lutzomyia longipalpis TaxID=7200 RepID=UPI002483DEAB|nr:protein artichoke-like [Lutzomyia longipalpis]